MASPIITDGSERVDVVLHLSGNGVGSGPIAAQFNNSGESCEAALVSNVPHEGGTATNNRAALNERFSLICRFCLVESDDLLDIFDRNYCIREMISMISSIQLALEDVFPKNVCMICYDQLTKCIRFKQQVETADVTLKRCIVEQVQTLPENDTDIKCELQTPHETEETAIHESSSNELESPNNFDELIEEDYGTACVMVYEGDPITDSECDKDSEQGNDADVSPLEEIADNLTEDINAASDNPNDDSELIVQKRIERVKCDQCRKEFTSQSLLNKHMRIHTSQTHVCGECHKSFPRAANLECHLRTHRAENAETEESGTTFKCTKCDASFKVERDLFIHGSIHLEGGKNQCRECLKEFPNLPKLKRHIKTHYEDKPIKCEQCGRGFPEMASLTRHYRIHTNEQRERKHVCNKCGKSYYDLYSLSVHERVHTGEKPWICTICDRRFTDSRLLNSHMRVHTDTRNYPCTMCDKSFTHRSTLVSHLRTHTGEKPYVCSVCNKSFIQSSNLVHHMRVHSGDKPYKCPKCPKMFGSSSSLSTHIRTHTGEKPYSCKLCGKRFTRHNLTVHMRTHTGEKPYECNECSRKFRTSGQLTQHKITHTDNKPYVCKVCNKRWSTSWYLKKHMQTHALNADGSVSDEPTDPAEPAIEDGEVSFNQQQHHHRIRIEEIQSDAEFNENAMLVNDLLASVVNVNTDVLQSGHVEMPELSTNDSNPDFTNLRNVINTNRFNVEDSNKTEMVADGVYVTEV